MREIEIKCSNVKTQEELNNKYKEQQTLYKELVGKTNSVSDNFEILDNSDLEIVLNDIFSNVKKIVKPVGKIESFLFNNNNNIDVYCNLQENINHLYISFSFVDDDNTTISFDKIIKKPKAHDIKDLYNKVLKLKGDNKYASIKV